MHPPASPSVLPEHVKCNILKAQMEANFRKEGPVTPRTKTSSETLNDRYHSSSQDSAGSSLTTDKAPHRPDCKPTPERLQPKANTNTNRRKRLVRQFSFNHEDEDDLPEALAKISSQSHGKSGSNSSLDRQIHPSIYPQVETMPALEPGSPGCPSPSSTPHLSPSFYNSSNPHLVPYLAADSGEEMRLDREKLLRALLTTQL